MKPESSFYQTLLLCAVSVAALVFISGCNSPVVGDSETAGEKKLPKMKFHKPKSFDVAVSRLEELHGAVMAEGDLPAPKVFDVVEVVHGTGAGAHSHYHLADEDHDHDGHGHVTSSEKTHEVEVDAVTELVDIVRWLPKIAGDGDMEKETWEQVKSESKKLSSELEQIADSMALSEKRTALQKFDSQLSGFVTAMSALVAEAAGSNAAEPEGN